MRRGITILLTIVLFLILGNHANAIQSSEFIDFVSQKIYDECQGNDLNIKQSSIRIGGKELPSVVKWQYDIAHVKELINIFSQAEPFDITTNPECKGGIRIGGRLDGCKVVTCGEHYLTISMCDYFLDGNKLNLPAKIINNEVTNQINNPSIAVTSGSNSPATSGEKSPIKQNNVNLTIIMKVVFAFSLAFNVGLTIYILLKNKKKVKNKSM